MLEIKPETERIELNLNLAQPDATAKWSKTKPNNGAVQRYRAKLTRRAATEMQRSKTKPNNSTVQMARAKLTRRAATEMHQTKLTTTPSSPGSRRATTVPASLTLS